MEMETTEKAMLAAVLKVLPLSTLVQIAAAINQVSKHGYGRVEISVNQGQPFILYTTLAKKIEK